MNSANGLQRKVLWVVGGLFGLLILGMIIFAFLKQSELNQTSQTEINSAASRINYNEN